MPVHVLREFGAVDMPMKLGGLSKEEKIEVDRLAEEARAHPGVFWKQLVTAKQHFVVLKDAKDDVKVIVSRCGIEVWCE